MIPWSLLDTAHVPGGGELRLMRRGAEFSIMLGGNQLMNSRVRGSEEALATIACERIRSCEKPRILIGGLGMGFTLRAALAAPCRPDEVNGTTQRCSGRSQARQCGDFKFLMLVIGAPPNCGDPGIPQRSIASSRTPSVALRTTGAIWSGKMPGSGGMLPTLSRIARVNSMIACWPLVTL